MKTKFLQHVYYLNFFDPKQFVPFIVAGVPVGYIHYTHITALTNSPLFIEKPEGIVLTPTLKTPEERTTAVFEFCEKLHKQGIIKKWRGELFSVSRHFGSPELMRMERESTKFFGIMNYGVVLNGMVNYRDGTQKMWIATRSFTKSKYPGKLDNMVNGGFTAGYTAREILIKESMEEAGMSEALITKAHAAGCVSYKYMLNNEVHQSTVFVFDIALPMDFLPTENDGEVDHFELLPIQEIMDIIMNTESDSSLQRSFKTNCNIIIIDWLIRHGYITSEDSEFIPLVQKLRS